MGYESYWDEGYFEGRGLRLLHLDNQDLIVMMSPNHRVYQVLVGPSFKTAKGLGLGASFEVLKQSYPDAILKSATLNRTWLYRPDRVTPREEVLGFLGFEHQSKRKALRCAATSASLPNVTFFFESCEKASKRGVIEAILVTHPDDSDLQPVDPFMSLSSISPCPEPRTEDPEALMQTGLRLLREDKMGDHLSQQSIEKGLPVLRDAALSGSISAAGVYAAVVHSYIHQEVIGDPLNRPIRQGAEEAMLLTLLSVLRGDQPPRPDSCEAAILHFEKPLSADLFGIDEEGAEPEGVCSGYSFLYFEVEELEALRQQARAWKECWPSVKATGSAQ